MFSIQYLLMSFLNHVFSLSLAVLIYQLSRCVLFVLLMCPVHGYWDRIRDWVVNVQWMVKEVFERRTDQTTAFEGTDERESSLA